MFVTNGGLAVLAELPDRDVIDPAIAADRLRQIATQRAALGYSRAYAGIVGADEEKSLNT